MLLFISISATKSGGYIVGIQTDSGETIAANTENWAFMDFANIKFRVPGEPNSCGVFYHSLLEWLKLQMNFLPYPK